MVLNKIMKLFFIKIEDSGIFIGLDLGDIYVFKCSQVYYFGFVGGDEKLFVLNDNFKVFCFIVG